jgi:hypothetical protein
MSKVSKRGDAPDGKLLKYTFYVWKNPKLTEEEFHEHWRRIHACMPLAGMKKNGIVRYTQYHCTSATRSILDGLIAGRANSKGLRPKQLGNDGVVQIWFKDYTDWEGMYNETVFVEKIFEDEMYLFDLSKSYVTLGWEEDMLLDNEIVMPGYEEQRKKIFGDA